MVCCQTVYKLHIVKTCYRKWLHCYLKTTGNPGHQTQTDEDGGQEQDKEVKPHVGGGVCLQRHHTVLSSGKCGAKILIQ